MNVEAVVLAAGYSSRAEAFKLELEIGGKTVLERCIGGMLDLCSRIIVVSGYRIERVETLMKPYPKVAVVYNSRFDQGMFTSVKEGMRHVRGDRFFLTPGDYPLIGIEVCRSLLKIQGDIIIPTFSGRKGHPVLLAGSLAQALLEEDDTSNLRNFIRRQGYQTLEVDDEGILTDIDTPEDYRRVVARQQGGGV